jgi:hypothetical protein
VVWVRRNWKESIGEDFRNGNLSRRALPQCFSDMLTEPKKEKFSRKIRKKKTAY